MRNANSPYKKHRVKITFTSSMIVEIEATSEEQALNIAEREYSDLCADDFYGRSCDIHFQNVK